MKLKKNWKKSARWGHRAYIEPNPFRSGSRAETPPGAVFDPQIPPFTDPISCRSRDSWCCPEFNSLWLFSAFRLFSLPMSKAQSTVGLNATVFLTGAGIMAVAFLIKAGIWPLSFWLSTAYMASAAPVAAMFAIMTKVGVYVILRLAFFFFLRESLNLLLWRAVTGELRGEWRTSLAIDTL